MQSPRYVIRVTGAVPVISSSPYTDRCGSTSGLPYYGMMLWDVYFYQRRVYASDRFQDKDE